MKPIPGFPGYKIDVLGNVYNKKNEILSQREFRNTCYVRLSKEGKRVTISVNKLLFDIHDLLPSNLELSPGEIGIRYKETNYYITNHQNCYNIKTNQFLKPVFRNNYVSYSISVSGKKEVVYCLKFLKPYLKGA